MSGFSGFPLTPKDVPQVETRFRRIVTPIPSPGTRQVFEELERYESRSMHGQLPVVWDRAEDFQVFDRHGNCWIDFSSTIFVANAGHANPRIRKAIGEIIERPLLHTYSYVSEIRARYLKKLIEFTPASLEKAFLISAGTEATECAMKLMRLHARKAGKRRPGIISFEGTMHGRTVGAVMMGGTPESRAWVGFEDPNVHRLPVPLPWSMEGLSGVDKAERDLEAIAASGVELERDIGGIMIESYLGWSAALLPADYVQALASFARQHDILLCFDEIQSGFGRTGRLFAYEHYGVDADLVCCGKGISSSLPLAAVLGRREVMDLPDVGSMSSTHSANPLACAAGLANLEVIEEENLVAESRRKGELLHARLGEIQARHADRIGHVLGRGMVAGILLFDPETGAPDSETATRTCLHALEKGLILVHTGRESIKIGPPLTIPEEALAEGLDVFEEALGEATSRAGGK